MEQLDTQIGEWRAAILRSRAVEEADADELEEHLREQIADLEESGLSGDEAFLIAVGRLGKVDAVTAEYAREHSDRLWKQLAIDRLGGRRSQADRDHAGLRRPRRRLHADRAALAGIAPSTTT